MRRVLSIAFLSICAVASASDRRIREVDFANHTYPWHRTEEWPDRLEWQRSAEPNRINLVKGRWREPDSEKDQRYSGLTLEEVVYGDLTGDDADEAVVVIRYDTGGTQYHHFVYVFSPGVKGPRLLAWFRSGDRSANGLYQVSLSNCGLVVDLYDPDKQQGDCCSSGFIRQRYRWSGTAFTKDGAIQHGSPRRVSRRAVSPFGLPQDQ